MSANRTPDQGFSFEGVRPRQNEYDPSFVFRTAEEIESVEGKSVAPYFRPHDPLCAAVLKIGKTPADIQVVSKVFPFFRLASVLQTPPDPDVFGTWLVNAFYAGVSYGTLYPTQAEETAERAFGGHGYAHQRLHILKELLREQPATLGNLIKAFEILAENCKPDSGDTFEHHLINTTLKTAMVGFAGSTTGKADPTLSDFIEQLGAHSDMSNMSLLFRGLSKSMVEAEGKPVRALLPHPLLTLAEAQYPVTPVERGTILPFFHHQLGVFGVRSESECPVEDFDLLAWIDAGLHYGQAILENHPQTVEMIFKEITPGKLARLKEMAVRLRVAANGLSPSGLLGPLLSWHAHIYEWNQPAFYGQALTRAIYVADFAIWLPWLLN
jgi:hypothetical protein